MATKAEVQQRVGEDLGIVPVGQSLEAQDEARIEAAYLESYEQLKEKGLASWAYAGSVPTKLVPYFCLLVEERLLVSYSVPESRFLRIKTSAGENGALAIMKLAELILPEFESVDDVQDY